MPRLLYIINWDWYFRVHWLERATMALEEGFDVHVILPNTDQREVDTIRGAGLTVIEIPFSRTGLNPLREAVALARMYRAVKKLKPDLIQNITIKPNLYGSWIGALLRIPTVSSVTGLGFVFVNRSVAGRCLAFAVRWLYWLACRPTRYRLLFENKDDLQFMVSRKIIAPERAQLIPGAGVDTRAYASRPEPPASPVKILFASRILWNKGLAELIDATKILRQRQCHFRMIVAGIIDPGNPDGAPESVLHQWEKEGWIQWLGQHDNMPELLASVHIVALPTTYGEGIPRILIEAASCHRPTVATDVPGCREIVRHEENGLLIPPRNPVALADALERLVRDARLRQQLGRRGREIVVHTFAREIVMQRTFAVYRELLREGAV